MDIEPLLLRLESLAPSFGRAQEDIKAMVSRGRSDDYKGVMQNCRLVLEALLRALVSDVLKQTPGKAMLDELITKFRQQANAGTIPTNVLAHMGTVQAWGNLSSHDHATKLSDDGVKVGKLEVFASLNSMVAILEWYAGSFGQTLVPTQQVALSPIEAQRLAPVAKKKKPPMGMMLAGGMALIGVAGGGYLATRTATPTVDSPVPAGAAVSPFATLDALYSRWNEPLPPAACRSPKEALVLGAHSNDLSALDALPQNRSAEAWYIIARAQSELRIDAMPATTRALSCPGFAAAFNLAGKIAFKDKRFSEAKPSFEAALSSAPNYLNARFNLGMVHLAENRVAEAVVELKKVTDADPRYADAHYLLGMVYEKKQPDEAKIEFCAALDNGRADAREKCGR